MLKTQILANVLRGSKVRSLAGCLQNKRWTATASVEYDEMELASAKPYDELPSMLSLPLVGTMWVYLPIIGRYDIKKLTDSFMDKRKILGDIYRESFGGQRVVVSFDPDDLQTMYKHEGVYPLRNTLESLKAYRELRKDFFKTVGVILLNGEEWHDMRRKTQKHLMKPRAIQAFLSPMQDVARDLVQKIHKVKDANNEVPNFLGELYKWALESISLVGLDTRLGCLELNLPRDSDAMKMINGVQTAFDCISKLEAFSGRLQMWKFFPTPTWKKYVKANDIFTEIAFKHINKSIEKLKNEADEDKDLTLLQSLIMEKGMDSSAAMVMVSDMMMAGIDTTSHTIGFFLYNMAKNPDKQEKLYDELKTILPRKEDKINQSIFNELRYLKACIKESQRKDPIVSGHVRILDHDVIFSGYRIPAETLLVVNTQGIGRDEKYFSKPDEYLPERWLSKDENFHPFAYLPFGFGVRSCIGRRLAELEIISLAVELIRNFRIEYHYEDIGIETRLVNVPDKPLRFNFIER